MKGKRDNSGNVIVTVEGEIIAETEKAILLTTKEVAKKWMAKSQIQKPTVQIDDDTSVIFVPTWIAKANGWSYDGYDPEDWPTHMEPEEDTLGSSCTQDYDDYPYDSENPAPF